jgi:putative addiction module component (TIGR02574 family)
MLLGKEHTEAMSMIELEREMLKLGLKERATLAQTLLRSLDEPSEAELESLWAEESDRRVAAFDRGEMRSYSREEMLKRVKAVLP